MPEIVNTTTLLAKLADPLLNYNDGFLRQRALVYALRAEIFHGAASRAVCKGGGLLVFGALSFAIRYI